MHPLQRCAPPGTNGGCSETAADWTTWVQMVLRLWPHHVCLPQAERWRFPSPGEVLTAARGPDAGAAAVDISWTTDRLPVPESGAQGGRQGRPGSQLTLDRTAGVRPLRTAWP